MAYIVGTQLHVDLVKYQNGLANLPFQYRALVAWLLHALVRLDAFVELAHLLPNPFRQPEVLGLAAINMLAVIAVTEIVRRSIALFVKDAVLPNVLCLLMPLSMYFSYVALANSYRLSFPYDVPNLPLFAACIYAMLLRKVVMMQIAFALACLSRETSVFLILIYLLYEADRLRSAPVKIAANAFVMGVIWVAAKFLMFSLYGSNPPEAGAEVGGLFIFMLGTNLEFLVRPQYWPNLLSAGGFLWIIPLVAYRYIPSGPLRRTLWVVVPWLASMLVVGTITEVRIFGELTVLLSIVGGVGIANFLASRGYGSAARTVGHVDAGPVQRVAAAPSEPSAS